MARKKRTYTWFLAPKDAETNAVISRYCDDFLSEVLCADGKRRNLWRCNVQLRDAMIASKERSYLAFEIFCQEGNGKIKKVTFLFMRKKAFNKG